MHQGLQPKSAASYEPIQEAAAHTMIRDILAEPDGQSYASSPFAYPTLRLGTGFQTHAKTYAASVIMTSLLQRLRFGRNLLTFLGASHLRQNHANSIRRWLAQSCDKYNI